MCVIYMKKFDFKSSRRTNITPDKLIKAENEYPLSLVIGFGFICANKGFPLSARLSYIPKEMVPFKS